MAMESRDEYIDEFWDGGSSSLAGDAHVADALSIQDDHGYRSALREKRAFIFKATHKD